MPDKSSEPWTVAIIGCGAIAGGYDMGMNDSIVRTHAKAFNTHPAFRIAACVEPDDGRRRTFCDNWPVEMAFEHLSDLFSVGLQIDVASVCVPTADHAEVLETLIDHAGGLGLKCVFAEKPLTDSPTVSQSIVERYAAAGLPLAVNYMRRWNRTFIALQYEIAAGQWGNIRKIVWFYNKGVLNNGSHMLDLLGYLAGAMTLEHMGAAVADYTDTDPTVDFILRAAAGYPIYCVGTNSNDYAFFEAVIVAEDGVITIEDGCRSIRKRRRGDSDVYRGYRDLGAADARATSYADALTCAVDNIDRVLRGEGDLVSSGATAIQGEAIAHQVLYSVSSDKENNG